MGLDTYCKVAKLTAKEQRPKAMRKRPRLAKSTLRRYADGQFRVAMGSNGVGAGGKRRESGERSHEKDRKWESRSQAGTKSRGPTNNGELARHSDDVS